MPAATINQRPGPLSPKYRPAPPSLLLSNRPRLSSLPLQMLLSFNTYYSAVYFFIYAAVLSFKHQHHLLTWTYSYTYSDEARLLYVSPIIYTVWCLAELGRLHVGYRGNLQESTAHTTGLFFLTLFPQFPIIVYFLCLQQPIFPIDVILNAWHIILLSLELLCTVVYLYQLVRAKTARFTLEYGEVNATNEQQLDDHHVALQQAAGAVNGRQPAAGQFGSPLAYTQNPLMQTLQQRPTPVRQPQFDGDSTEAFNELNDENTDSSNYSHLTQRQQAVPLRGSAYSDVVPNTRLATSPAGKRGGRGNLNTLLATLGRVQMSSDSATAKND